MGYRGTDIQPRAEREDQEIGDRLIRLAASGCLACCLSMAAGVIIPLVTGTALPLGGLAVSAAATGGVFALAIAITRIERRAHFLSPDQATANASASATGRYGAENGWQL